MRLLDFLLARTLKAIAGVLYKAEAKHAQHQIRDLLQRNPASAEYQPVVLALIEAEDRRFLFHYGVDSASIFRAVIVIIFTNRIQGASTITQQLVRVLTRDYRRKLTRKFREMCIAAWIDSRFQKYELAVIYLNVAYYGWRMNGYRQAVSRLGCESPCSISDAAQIVARLKYPEPQRPNAEKLRLIENRKSYILRLIETSNGRNP